MTTAKSRVWLSIVIPALNESQCIRQTLEPLQPYRFAGAEVILVDGGSTDSTVSLSELLVDKLVISTAGRARQMNVGAKIVDENSEVLLFLHADSQLPSQFFQELSVFRRTDEGWGAFDVKLDEPRIMFHVIAFMINLRSWLADICTGDQSIFLRKNLWNLVGGYDDIPLMEDVALCKKLKQMSKQYRIRKPVITSSRRWLKRGVWKTIWLMWTLRWKYWRGADPARLAELYR